MGGETDNTRGAKERHDLRSRKRLCRVCLFVCLSIHDARLVPHLGRTYITVLIDFISI